MDFSICAVISLGSASPRCSVQPTRGWLIPQEGRAHAETSSLPSSTDDFAPAWPCSRRGLPGHLHYGKRRWSLTPPFHHHPSPRRMEGLSVSVALVRQVHASRRFPRPGCYPTPCSVECGLSSIPTTQDRDCPTNLSAMHDKPRWRVSQPLKRNLSLILGKTLLNVGVFDKRH